MSGKQAQAQRYAQAVLQAMLERWQTVLNELSDTFSRDKQTYALLMDAGKDFAEREKALASALPDGTPLELANLLKLLLQEEDLDLLPETTGWTFGSQLCGHSGDVFLLKEVVRPPFAEFFLQVKYALHGLISPSLQGPAGCRSIPFNMPDIFLLWFIRQPG